MLRFLSLNSGQYRPWVLASTLFLCYICIRHGTHFNLLDNLVDGDLEELRNVSINLVLGHLLWESRKFYVSLPFARNACEYRVKVYRW